MRTINLAEQTVELADILEIADQEPVVLVALNGREYVLTEADDFEREVEQLRNSTAFQHFLDKRSAQNKPRTPLEEYMREIEAELASQQAAEL